MCLKSSEKCYSRKSKQTARKFDKNFPVLIKFKVQLRSSRLVLVKSIRYFNLMLFSISTLARSKKMQEPKYQGLVADMLPNIRLMQGFGHFIFKYITGPVLLRKIYSNVHLAIILFQFVCIVMNLAANTDEVSELTCKFHFFNVKFAVCTVRMFLSSQHHHGAVFLALHHEILIRGVEQRENLSDDGDLESIQYPPTLRRIRFSVKI